MMIKTSNTISYKGKESYLKAEWLPEGDLVPTFIDRERIYPISYPNLEGTSIPQAYFFVYASGHYSIMSSADEPLLSQSQIQSIKEDTLAFVNQASQELTDYPNNGEYKIKWSGNPSISDLSVKLLGKRIKLDQKALGSALVTYYILVDVYSVPTHKLQLGYGLIPIQDIRVFGIFLNDHTQTANLTLFPTQEIEDPNRLPDDIDKWEPWCDDEGKDYTAANQRHGWVLELSGGDGGYTEFTPWETVDETANGSSGLIEDGALILEGDATGLAFLHTDLSGIDETFTKMVAKVSAVDSGLYEEVYFQLRTDETTYYYYMTTSKEYEIEYEGIPEHLAIAASGEAKVTIEWINFE